MNTRTNQSMDTSVAQDLVFENLGIENADLGNDDADTSGLEDDHEFGDGDPLGGEDGDDDPFVQVHQDPDPNDGRQQQQQQRVSHTPRPLPKKSEVKADAKGNLLNAKGEIVARAGSEARLYQGRQKAQRDLATAQAEVQDVSGRLQDAIRIGRGLHSEVQQYKAQHEQLKQFGFSAEDQISAMQLFSEIRKNPGATIQKLLTRAAANGIQVTSAGNPGGIDPKGIAEAIKEVLGAELKPIRDRQAAEEQERARQKQQQDEQAAVQNEVNVFFRRNPDAVEYLPVFKRVMADPKYQGYSLGEIYARILRANRQQPSGNGRQQSRSRTPQRGSPPNGNNRPPSNGSSMAPVDDSYDTILKDVMKTAGY